MLLCKMAMASDYYQHIAASSTTALARLLHTTHLLSAYTCRCLSLLLQMERRERLRKLIAEREAAGEGVSLDGAPLIGQVGVGQVGVELAVSVDSTNISGGAKQQGIAGVFPCSPSW